MMMKCKTRDGWTYSGGLSVYDNYPLSCWWSWWFYYYYYYDVILLCYNYSIITSVYVMCIYYILFYQSLFSLVVVFCYIYISSLVAAALGVKLSQLLRPVLLLIWRIKFGHRRSALKLHQTLDVVVILILWWQPPKCFHFRSFGI